MDLILDEIGADGVYWDELEYSAYRYHYGEPWDGCSADIDQKSMKIARLKSSVTLLSQPWRVALAKKILARGPLVGNGQPHTRTMAALHFPRFVETGSPSNCAEAQLHSPIALGDHLTERSEVDAYRNMLGALDYGCLYHWYNDLTVMPTHPTLTAHMYPITPMELHEGYMIGRERIITTQRAVRLGRLLAARGPRLRRLRPRGARLPGAAGDARRRHPHRAAPGRRLVGRDRPWARPVRRRVEMR